MYTFTYISSYGNRKVRYIHGLRSMAEAQAAWADLARYLPGAVLVSITG